MNEISTSRASILHTKEAIGNVYISDIFESLFPLCDRHVSERIHSCFQSKQVSLSPPSIYIVALPYVYIINGVAKHMLLSCPEKLTQNLIGFRQPIWYVQQLDL